MDFVTFLVEKQAASLRLENAEFKRRRNEQARLGFGPFFFLFFHCFFPRSTPSTEVFWLELPVHAQI